jgi:signal transduction histidine kinase
MTKPKDKILIVDDSVLISEYLQALLEKNGFETQISDNGIEALDKALKYLPNLILLDIIMPELDGYETCKRLKEIDKLKSIPVIFVSSLNYNVDKVEAFNAGGVDFVTKPIEAPELIARINTHLHLTSLQRNLENTNAELLNQITAYQQEIVKCKSINKQLEVEKNKAEENERIGRNLSEKLRGTEFKYQKEFEIKILNAILETEEKERTKFAQELHDGLGPLITSALLYLQKMEEDNSQDTKYLKNTIRFIEEALDSITEISNLLSPGVLKKFGLVSAISFLIRKYQSKDGPVFKFATNFNQKLDYSIEISVYRIISELITNTLKHANASSVIILLNKTENNLILEYKDNGQDFDFKNVIFNSERLGWYNIQNRINLLGGQLFIDKNSNNEVEIKISIPC